MRQTSSPVRHEALCSCAQEPVWGTSILDMCARSVRALRWSLCVFLLPFLAACSTGGNKEINADLISETSTTESAEEEVAAEDEATPGDDFSDDDFLADLEEEFAEDEEGEGVVDRRDPLKPWNLACFHFNDKLYLWFVRPVSKGYAKTVPRGPRKGLHNFFTNLKFPMRFGSCLLQGRMKDSGIVLARFCINSTIGMFGFIDLGKKYGLEGKNEDVDQAFGRWKIPPGWYVVWPFLGPSSLRGTAGYLGDVALTPTTYLPVPVEASVGAALLTTINKTSLDPDEYKRLMGATLAPYIALREAYIQNREKLVEE